MNWDMDLTFIADGQHGLGLNRLFAKCLAGMTTIEHALPVPQLYEDVLTFYALSGTGSTPTHIVNYGGAWGEQLVWAHQNVPNDPKYVSFFIALKPFVVIIGPTQASSLHSSRYPGRPFRDHESPFQL
jgi:hypothetical protein